MMKVLQAKEIYLSKMEFSKLYADRQNGRLMGTHSTGNGRRQSYAHPPMPRMTNTFMSEGKENPKIY